jgi:hypothetical protein
MTSLDIARSVPIITTVVTNFVIPPARRCTMTNRSRLAAKFAAEAAAQFNRDVADGLADKGEFGSYVADYVHDAMVDAEFDAACEREAFGIPEDSPCIQSADVWGTGEGQYHGVI